MQVVEALDIETAIEPKSDFLYIVFEALERLKFSGMYHDTIADYTNLVGAFDLSFFYKTPCNCTHFAYRKGLLYVE